MLSGRLNLKPIKVLIANQTTNSVNKARKSVSACRLNNSEVNHRRNLFTLQHSIGNRVFEKFLLNNKNDTTGKQKTFPKS